MPFIGRLDANRLGGLDPHLLGLIANVLDTTSFLSFLCVFTSDCKVNLWKRRATALSLDFSVASTRDLHFEGIQIAGINALTIAEALESLEIKTVVVPEQIALRLSVNRMLSQGLLSDGLQNLSRLTINENCYDNTFGTLTWHQCVLQSFMICY